MLLWIAVVSGVLVLAFVGLLVWARVTSPTQFPLGSLAFEAELSLDPLIKTIAAREVEMARAEGARAAELQREIAFLRAQGQEMRAIVERRDRSPGRGYVGFDAYGAGESSWAKASRS